MTSCYRSASYGNFSSRTMSVTTEPLNNTLDDVCAVIGYTATRVLQAWFHRRNLYVPQKALLDHPLQRLVGRSAFVRLVDEFGGQTITIPSAAEDHRYFVQRAMAEQIANGFSDRQLAEVHGLTVARVGLLRRELVEAGWVEFAKGCPPQRPLAGRRNKGLSERLVRNF